MAWAYLFAAGILEIIWATFMKQSEGFTRPTPTTLTFVFMAASIWLLGLAMKQLPLGTAYAIWTGIGAIGAFVVGVAMMGEAVTPLRVGSAALIVLGLVGLRLATPG